MKTSKTRGATKVANVKLRPAQASSSRPSKRQVSIPRVGLHEEDAAQGEVDISAGNTPFAGIVLCATGDVNKRTLFAHAQELGATRANDFTDLVTHLIADAPGSAKYRCAVERNLPILKESWVEEAYHTWLKGDIVNLEQTIDHHHLPIFSGVRLCITGIDDIGLRNKIHALLTKENGVYLKSLDKTATHLLCSASEESPKMKWASDYNRTQSMMDKIHIIWEEWFWDSLEFGGRWDEREYEVTKPRPSRKSPSQIPDPCDPNSSQNFLPTATLSQRTPLPRSLPTSSLLGDDPPEYGKMNRDPDAGLRIFENIVQKRGYAVGSDGILQRTQDVDAKPTVSKAQLQVHAQPKPKLKASEVAVGADPDSDTNSVLTRLEHYRAKSFACATSPQPQSRQPFQRVASSTSSHQALVPQLSSVGSGSTNPTESRHFAGYTFRALGEAKGRVLRDALEGYGGRWLTEDDVDEDPDFLIVRLVSGGMFWRDEGDKRERAKFRTECWVEHCIFEERICAPHEHVVFTPLKIDAPVPGSETWHISLSGLDSVEMCWVKRLIRALGGNISPIFSRRSTHLLCPSGRGTKYEKAKEWGVIVVGMEWLINIATTGEVSDPSGFTVSQAVATEIDDGIDQKMSNCKGKGKATAIDDAEELIVDITNGDSEDAQSFSRGEPSNSFKDSGRHEKGATLDISRPARPQALQSQMDADLSRAPFEDYSESDFSFGTPSKFLLGSSSGLPNAKENVGAEILPLSPLPLATPKHPPKRFSEAEIEEDKRTTRIPSSHTPSPLKIPSKPTSACSPPISETRGLRTAITALLGKRNAEATDDADGPVHRLQGRTSKRPRLPSKGNNTISVGSSALQGGGGPSPALSFMSGSPPLSRLPSHVDADAIQEEQASLRVVYEDPDQRDEKRRLIALFEGGTATGGSRLGSTVDSEAVSGRYTTRSGSSTGKVLKKVLVRRSTRTSGI